MNTELYIGIMSGTSLDAVDAVIVSFAGDCTLHASYHLPIPQTLRQQILSISSNQKTTISAVGVVDHTLGKLYATAVDELLKKSHLRAEDITAIGNHGQTVYHQPVGETPFTIQLGDANLIAALSGIDTVADFRRMDMALGGQGAPLAPAFHRYLFKPRNSTTIVLNIGGIANVTVIKPNADITGFDTGPGNILMDAWCEQHTGQNYDHNADWAAQGRMIQPLLDAFMADAFMSKAPPKSTGREHFNLQWLDNHLTHTLPPQDIQRTLCEFTALSIASQVQDYTSGNECELLVCGGGAHNPMLMQQLRQYLPQWLVIPTSERNIPVDYMEAMAFAWLARQCIHNKPGNLPVVTGARQKASLGVLYPAPGKNHD